MSLSEAPQAASGSNAIGFADSATKTKHIFFRGKDDELWKYWENATGWQRHQQLRQMLSLDHYSPPANGTPCGLMSFGGQHIFYRGNDDELRQYYNAS